MAGRTRRASWMEAEPAMVVQLEQLWSGGMDGLGGEMGVVGGGPETCAQRDP